jgi:hypothetical protein
MPDRTAPADRDEAAYQAWIDARRRPQELPSGADPGWIIRYADKDMPDEIFSGEDAEDAARRRFDQQRAAWTIHLFMEVARA